MWEGRVRVCRNRVILGLADMVRTHGFVTGAPRARVEPRGSVRVIESGIVLDYRKERKERG